jgi:DNA-binding transcriptional MerR regulator
MLDMQPAFVRRLDTEGVVCPARSAGGQRRYSRVELNHIAALAALMGDGMTLLGAQRIIELENEVAELRRQLAVEINSRKQANRLNADRSLGPGTVVEAELADGQALVEMPPSVSTPGVAAAT